MLNYLRCGPVIKASKAVVAGLRLMHRAKDIEGVVADRSLFSGDPCARGAT